MIPTKNKNTTDYTDAPEVGEVAALLEDPDGVAELMQATDANGDIRRLDAEEVAEVEHQANEVAMQRWLMDTEDKPHAEGNMRSELDIIEQYLMQDEGFIHSVLNNLKLRKLNEEQGVEGEPEDDGHGGVDGDGEPEPEGLTNEAILNIIGTEMLQSVAEGGDGEVEGDRIDALDYYLGNPRGDEKEARSQIVSTDVADAIEWILPQIIKAMVAKGPVISFDSISEEDDDQAALETEFTHDTFMKENEGFLNLYEFVKDALLQKNGILKIYYDKKDVVKPERYDGLTTAEFDMISQMPGTTVTAMSEEINEVAMLQRHQQLQQLQQTLQQLQQTLQSMQGESNPQEVQALLMQGQQLQGRIHALATMPPEMIISCEVEVTTSKGKVRVDCLPPEEFRVTRNHDSLSLLEARFTAHVRLRTRSELIEDGYDAEVIMGAESNLSDAYTRQYRFTSQGESSATDADYSEDSSQDLLEVSECYVMIDVEKSGRAKLMQITVLGSETPTDILEIIPVEENPFVATSCIIMSHKFLGLSIYDRLRQLQDQKTSLWRNIMDNLYLQNNREKEVVENQVNMDDLLVSRPGGIKRVKQPGMIRELAVQPIGQEGYQMLDYLDQVRTGRVGVSPETAGQVDALGTAVGSEGVARLMTAKDELVGLMVRAVAETGMKPAYLKIRNLQVRFQDTPTHFKFKGEWQDVNPMEWGERSRTTINVGTGTGDDQRKVGAIQQVIAYQAQLSADPEDIMIEQSELFESLDEFCKVAGLSSASPYFVDPASKEGKRRAEAKGQQSAQAKQQKDATDKQMVDAQTMLGQAEQMKGQAALASQEAKLQIESSSRDLSIYKQESDNEKAALELQLDQAKASIKALESSNRLEFDYAKLEVDEALKLTEMELKHKRELSATNQSNKGDIL